MKLSIITFVLLHLEFYVYSLLIMFFLIKKSRGKVMQGIKCLYTEQ